MAAFFIDLDGTVLRYHTSEWLPGVVERLTSFAANGHQIVFISMRDDARDADTEWSESKTRLALQSLPFGYHFLSGIQSPRVLIDDTQPLACKVETNNSASWAQGIA